MAGQKRDGNVWKQFEQNEGDSNIQLIASDDICKVLKVSEQSGEGFLTIYQVFDGVYLMHGDYHMKGCRTEFQIAKNTLALEHCREGRVEHENCKGAKYYMQEGDLRIDRMVHREGMSSFPLAHYHGMTIGIELDIAQQAIDAGMPGVKIDLNRIAEKFCDEEKNCIMRGEPRIERIFAELYQVPANLRISYYRLKIMELLLYLDSLEPSEYMEERPYFQGGVVDKVKAMHDFITTNLEEDYTLAELAEMFQLAETTMRKCFKAVYGSPVGNYLKRYRINTAASMLVQEGDKKVADVGLAVGYDSPAKFSAAFRSVMGMTPLEYKNKIYNKEQICC